jgi:hypothetical protein
VHSTQVVLDSIDSLTVKFNEEAHTHVCVCVCVCEYTIVTSLFAPGNRVGISCQEADEEHPQ